MVMITPITSEGFYKDSGMKFHYPTLVHEIVMSTWEQFRNDLHARKEKSDHEHRISQERKQRETAESLEAQERNRDYFSETLFMKIAERQANYFNHLESPTFELHG